jgi:hypothetical protein
LALSRRFRKSFTKTLNVIHKWTGESGGLVVGLDGSPEAVAYPGALSHRQKVDPQKKMSRPGRKISDVKCSPYVDWFDGVSCPARNMPEHMKLMIIINQMIDDFGVMEADGNPGIIV